MKKESAFISNLPNQSAGRKSTLDSSGKLHNKVFPQLRKLPAALLGNSPYSQMVYGGTECYVDGMKTSCAVAFGLLNAGFAYEIE